MLEAWTRVFLMFAHGAVFFLYRFRAGTCFLEVRVGDVISFDKGGTC